MAKRGGGEWVGAITATAIDRKMDGIFADVAAARQTAKLARITARKSRPSAKAAPGKSSPDLLLAEEPIYSVCLDASDWLLARMIVEGKLVPLNLAEVRRPDWEELFRISQ